MHITTCPYCGAHDSHPIEDGWWCSSCEREYPTRAFKCPHPGCWEYEIVCKIHNKNSPAAHATTTLVSATTADATCAARGLAKTYRNKVLAWLLASLFLSFFAGSVSSWAGAEAGWEAKSVQTFFGFVGVTSLLLCLVFCVLLYRWLTGYKAAVRDSSRLLHDRDLYLQAHRDVFGPIPWRSRHTGAVAEKSS